MTLRVHELAKELKLTSKELIDKLNALKIDAKSHMSVLPENSIKVVRASLIKPPVLVKKTTPPSAGVVDKPMQTASIENVKRELLRQRGAVKSVHIATEIKKPRTPSSLNWAGN